MTRYKAATVGALTAVLVMAPVASAIAGGNGSHHGYGHYYGNPLYPIVGLAAAVVGTAAAIVTLPFQIIGAAAAQASYYPPAQGYGAPGYAAPPAYYPAPAVAYAPPATVVLLRAAGALLCTASGRLRRLWRRIQRLSRIQRLRGEWRKLSTEWRGWTLWRTQWRWLRAAADPLRSPEWQLQPAQPASQRLQHALGISRASSPDVRPAVKRKAAPPPDRKPAAPVRRRGGRPSRDEAARLSDRILDAATDLFFQRGYGATSIEAVARSARISKRTFYHRYQDKAALFGAVLHRIIEGLRPPATLPLVTGADLTEILRRLAGLILHAALTPQAVALHRLIVGESARFPKLAAAVTSEGATQEAIELIGGLLQHEIRAGRLALDDPLLAAEQFLQLVLSVPQRRALGLGKPMTPKELERWADAVVDLFLNGCRARREV